jgi:mRNA-decapping enzyme subunit 2
MWRTYKLSVPTFGAIILDQDMSHILLVQGFYSKCSWGFPKGKINEGEESARCAVREVNITSSQKFQTIAQSSKKILINLL